MQDWSIVKKMTMWDYEELIEKISEVFSYSFIQEHYNHSMNEASDYLRELLGYSGKHEKHVVEMADMFGTISRFGVKNYFDLVYQVENKEKCERFLGKTGLPFEDLVSVLRYVFRWVLPHCLYLTELIDGENESNRICLEKLRTRGIRFNLDILEHGRTPEDRETLSKETGIRESFILNLVKLADMSRLPYSNRKTVKHLFAGGYDSLARIAGADSLRFKEDMKSYFRKKGVIVSGFIDLEGIAQWAKTLPVVVEGEGMC